MSQPTLERDTSVYAPVSGLAVASLIVAGLFALVVLMFGGVAFFNSTPMLLPTWLVLVPVLAIVLALLAQRQIRASEGTRSGSSLASWALGLSLLCGLGYYLGYLFPTYKAVTIQADNFVREWFGKIRDGEVNAAFLETLDLDQRRENPRDEEAMEIRFGSASVSGKGPLTSFQDGEIVQLLRATDADSTITNLGVRTWDFQNGYRVVQVYRVTTPEGDFDLQVTAYRSDLGAQRTWRIAEPETRVEQRTLSARGREIRSWQVRARQFATAWFNERSRGNVPIVFLFTQPSGERQKIDRAFEAAAVSDFMAQVAGNLPMGPAAVGSNLAVSANARLSLARFLPGFHTFSAKNFLDQEKLRVDEKLRQEVRDDLASLLDVESQLRARLSEGSGYRVLPDGRLEVWFDVELSKQAQFAFQPAYLCAGRIFLESDIPLQPETTPDWRIVKLKIARAGVPAPEGPGQGPRQGPPGIPH
ncbi:MAG: hypothetical protein AB7K24_27865 [Gemmataceae bacterium]